MRDGQNIRELVELQPDYIGFIFYPKSKRFVGDGWNQSFAQFIPENIKKTGVFVDSTFEDIKANTERYRLDAIQLHGNESGEFCQKVKGLEVEVTKAFPIKDSSDFGHMAEYSEVTDYFLFDTKTDLYGGSGKKFDWNILNNYTQNKKFFLSGGISVDDAETLLSLNHPSVYCIDINSRFETEPGLKNISQVNQFIKTIRNGISS